MEYEYKSIEQKWQKRWDSARVFAAVTEPFRAKYYTLEMLPYPSGQLHMGHVRNYSIGDVVARFKRRNGFNVMHPIGWDALGLPAENAAMKHGADPYDWTHKNIDAMKSQMKRLGVAYDWDREVATSEPEYYRWNQWFFIRLYEKGLAYRKKGTVNWCPSCQTVLANEQVIAGRCWRCDSEVTIRQLEQWYFRITDYADRLLKGLERLDQWPEKVVTMQRNWIGKSRGAYVDFAVEGYAEKIRVFTTRIDTIYGATFVVLSPDHPLVGVLAEQNPSLAEQSRTLRQEQVLRGKEDLEKAGFFTGTCAINPFNQQKAPIWVANYVLMDYGTGAIMAVPAHDTRDGEFARKYGLAEQIVIRNADGNPGLEEYGTLVESGPYSGLSSEEAMEKMTAQAASAGFGEAAVTFKIKDWGISRQRYWGTPIPMIHCGACGIVPVPDDQLPVLLPKHIPLTGEKGSPLAQVPGFVDVKCPKCGGSAKRDTDTMDTFVDSSWYFFRYCSPKEDQAMFDSKEVAYWMPIDMYIGGVEHAILHLIYCRFFTKLFFDMGMISFDEPINRLFTQGMVIKDGAKMSKSKGNVVDPDELIDRFGADTVRVFSIFTAPPEKELEWSDTGVEGSHRFLHRVHRVAKLTAESAEVRGPASVRPGEQAGPQSPSAVKLRRKTHQTIRKVTLDIEERFHLNTTVSAIMELVNAANDFAANQPDAASNPVMREAVEAVVHLLNPIAPHITEELWEALGHQDMLTVQPWPKFDPDLAREEEATVVVQVNGKLRGSLLVSRGLSQEDLLKLAREDEKVRKHLENKEIIKVVFVPDKLLNVVVKG